MEPSKSSSSSDPTGPTVSSVEVRDCPIDSVVVYTSNQAEITRRVKAKLAKGTNELLVKNLVATAGADSVRVSAGSGKGVVLLEV